MSGPNVSYVSATEVECYQPSFSRPFLAPSYVELSLDGQVYSQSLTAYDIIGDAVGLMVPSEVGTVALAAAAVTQFPDIDVYTVDHSKCVPPCDCLTLSRPCPAPSPVPHSLVASLPSQGPATPPARRRA